MAEIIINPCEGAADINNWAAHVKAAGASGGGDDFKVARDHILVAPASGVVTQAGGDTFNSIIIKIDGDPAGRSVRLCENANVHVKKGQHVKVFDVIAEGTLFREGEYKATHINGINSKGVRIPFLPMVTMTKAAAHAALTPPPLKPTERRVGIENSRRRTDAKLNAPIGAVPLNAGSVHTVMGWKDGDAYEGSTVWFDVDGLWSHSKTFTDAGIHDLADLSPAPPAEPAPPVEAPPIQAPPADHDQGQQDQPPAELPPAADDTPTTSPPPPAKPVSTIGWVATIIGIIAAAAIGLLGWISGWGK
jgi:hypothetical protein